MLSLLLTLLLAAQASASPNCPSGRAIIDALSVKADSWETGCGRLDDGRILIAAVDRGVWADGKRHVVAAITGGAAPSSRVEIPFAAAESKEIVQATSDAEAWKIDVAETHLGKGIHVRLGVLVNHGEDFFLGEEIVVLLRIAGNSISPIWTGLGDRFDKRFDSCVLDTRASFSLTSDGRVSRLRETKRSFRNAGIDGKLAADLRRKCIAPPKRTDLFPTR